MRSSSHALNLVCLVIFLGQEKVAVPSLDLRKPGAPTQSPGALSCHEKPHAAEPSLRAPPGVEEM